MEGVRRSNLFQDGWSRKCIYNNNKTKQNKTCGDTYLHNFLPFPLFFRYSRKFICVDTFVWLFAFNQKYVPFSSIRLQEDMQNHFHGFVILLTWKTIINQELKICYSRTNSKFEAINKYYKSIYIFFYLIFVTFVAIRYFRIFDEYNSFQSSLKKKN